MMKKALLTLILLLLAVTVLTACGGPERALLGTWEEKGSEENVVEFLDDGTVIWGGQGANYSLPDDTHIRLERGAAIMVLEFDLDGDTLTLSDGEDTLTMRRSQSDG